ncbi:protein unc-79 homolog isoform X4 [Pomacea canaliculata]|uniref:protein unc-79 homolog isoform X4 n=1 Tax=Pomacea canaliculata TaxID=400727 RepID=UPI000D72B3C6|nr:protein unc-79 homolog isoform X4 [Pomacea canaliculata]
MATRAATFTSKIRNLKDFHYRITNNLTTQPTGTDIANTLKYFSQTLLSVLKDVPSIPAESYGPKQRDSVRDSVRLSIFPNLNYSGLYEAVLGIIDLVPLIQIGQLDVGEAVLNVLGCLVPFLEHDLLDSLPYTVASTLAIFPPTLHKDTIDLLCCSLLPMTLGYDGCSEPTYASESAAAIITMVFQHTENGAFHSQILECFMSMKKNIINDILSIIAYGPPSAKAPAAHLLFYYWPQLNPSLSDRRGIHYKYCAWPPILCQRKGCINSGNCQAVKMCLNPALAIHSGDMPPPLYICSDCAEFLHHEHGDYMVDLLLPMPHVSTTCENKNCKSDKNIAICTCFSIECASYNGNRPIRYCASCHEQRHGQPDCPQHVFHLSITDIWSCSPEVMRYLMDAIVSLLKEASPLGTKRMVEMGEEHRQTIEEEEFFNVEDTGERKLLSRYGIWLLVELCTPQEDIPIEVLGRLLGMLFQWFDATAYLPDDNVGNALEKLKPEYVFNWLQGVMQTHFEVIVACLLPHPVEYSRVGGFWETLCTRTTQIKEGLNCFFCLVPYNIITFEIWDYVMPYWLESIRMEVPEDELMELKVLLSKAFDIDMCPLPFTLEKMYNFVSNRFEDPSASVQEQVLQWLQILSSLDIIIPMHLLLKIFKSGVEHIQSDVREAEELQAQALPQSVLYQTSPAHEAVSPMSPQRFPVAPDPCDLYERDTELVLPCFIIMLDILLKQMELQETPRHLGIYNETTRLVMSLLREMMCKKWDGQHSCDNETKRINCMYCQNIALWHQLASQLMEHVCPRDPLKLPPKDLPKAEEVKHQTISESPRTENAPTYREDKDKDFSIDAMPVYLQLYDALIEALANVDDTDALFALLTSLKFLILHGESLNYTINQYTNYITFTLDKTFIPMQWQLLQTARSHLATLIVPLLLHCMTLPTGATVLWHLVEDDFSSDDWKVRFAAVEKVTVLARCLESEMVRNNQVLQTSLAHAFCHMVGSVEDINSAVAQRTIMFLETIQPAGLKCLIQCLEFQFDTVIRDRCLILHRIQLLSFVLMKERILTWDFFLSRFDTLSLEAQVDLESTGDITCPTDLTSSDRHSEHFLKKVNRARLALARTDSIRSVSQSLKGKPPYRRAVSVPLHLITKGVAPPKVSRGHQEHIDSLPRQFSEPDGRKHSVTFLSKFLFEKDKSCVRQWSAPQFNLTRRMTTKLNLSSFSHTMFPGGHLREFTDEESNFAALLQRAMDLEGIDRDVVHHLVALLMKFMVRSEEQVQECDAKAQNVVLRHLNVLLGYNQTEKSFSVPPFKLRCSAVFNAFISGVPFVLDRNFKLGNTILPITLLLLQYSPSPQRYASDYQPPNYTLWYLEPHTRLSWLRAFLVILYKYQISTSPVSAIIQTLVQLVINTVEAQHHRCRKTDDSFLVPTPTVHRSKADLSKMSISDLENIQETDTPPQSPSSSKEEPEDKATVNVCSPPSASSVQYLKGQTDGAESSEGMMSDAECTPTLPGGKKDGVRRVSKGRQPRRIIEYSEPDSADDDVKAVSSKEEKKLEKKGPVRLQSPKDDSHHEHSQQGQGPGALSPKSAAVERKMAQQLHEFSKSHTEVPGKSQKSFEETGSTKAASSTTEASSQSARADGTTSDYSREAASEGESSEESEKTQTSDAESDRHHGATDSGGDATQEESKGETDEGATSGSRPSMVLKPNFRQRKERKTGLTTIELQRKFPDLYEAATKLHDEASCSAAKPAGRRARRAELLAKTQTGGNKKPISNARCGENVIVERCSECNLVLEQYDDETIGLSITVLATFIHREPTLATPMLLNMLQCVSRVASSSQYSWQAESNIIIPGNSVSIARQFLRCVLHQMAPNGIFPMLFQSNLDDPNFFKTMACALMDFNELQSHAPLLYLLEGLNERKNVPQETVTLMLHNLSTYLSCVSLESSVPMWTNILTQFDIFFRRLPSALPNACNVEPVLTIIITLLKVYVITNVRGILEPFSKVLSFAIQNCTFKLQQITDICSLCNRAFTRERDKLLLTRTVIFELVQAMRFKSVVPDDNLLMMVQFVVLDAGGTLCLTNSLSEASALYTAQSQTLISTCAAECMRQHLPDCIYFIEDLETLTKVKSNTKGGSSSLNEDTLGSQLKSGIAQYIALEIARGNGRDQRAITRYLPWLYHPPSAMQQGQKEFEDCIGHIRLLSWLLIGSLTNTAVTEGSAPVSCLPVPLEASPHIADHVMVIMTGFAKQSNATVQHMSSLFHAFILCQLWTMYSESAAAIHAPSSEQHQTDLAMIMDFWARVTPGILQLLSHSKVLAEMVNLHFLSLMEALQECNSSVLAKLFPMWTPILYTYHAQLPGHLQVRLQTVLNWEPPHPTKDQSSFNSYILLTWLKRIQFKLGQIEIQSAAATQIYVV